jgi:hypothetical protein
MKDVATKDFIKSELRALLEEMDKEEAPTVAARKKQPATKKTASRSTTRSST